MTMKKIRNVSYGIHSGRLPQAFDGFKIVMLSDLHDNVYGISLDTLYDMVTVQRPDIVVVAGDLLTRKRSGGSDAVVGLLCRLSVKYPVYFSNGNHETKVNLYRDRYGDRYDRLMSDLTAGGVHILNNSHADYYRGTELIRIYGLEIDKCFFDITGRPEMSDTYIEGKLGAPFGGYSILIAHNPMFFEKYAAWGAGLVLSGHVHGGIIRLPWGKGVLNPDYRLFPKYDGGEYSVGGSTMVLGRGLGAHTINVRINNPPELVTVTLCCTG